VSSERALALVCALSLLCGVARAQDEAQIAEARARFEQGISLADAGNCSGAIAEFNASLAIAPRPNTLFNIARCQETLNRYDLAIRAYEQYLELAPADDPDRATVEATMRQLRNLLGTIHVASNVPAEVWLADRVVGDAPGDVLVPGGRHVIELRAEGRIPDRHEVEVSARGEATVEFELRAAETHETTNIHYDAPPLPLAVTVATIGVAVATVAVGIGFGVNALVLSDEARALDPRLPRDLGAISDSALYADILYVAGGVLGATAIAMAFLTDWSDGADARRAREGARVIPIVGPLFAGVRVEGIE
jgi:tetratricopeptide (TPR) repeat protein